MSTTPSHPPKHRPARRGALRAAAAATLALSAVTRALARNDGAAALPGAEAFASEAAIAATRRQPLVLMFSLPGCGYCDLVRAEQLVHVYRDRERLGVRIVELRIDDGRAIPGLPEALTPAQLAARYRARVAPSVLFLDGRREVAERLVGYASRDFYGAYLDERIETARAGAAGAR